LIKDVTIAGHHIPKGTTILPQISAVLSDETQFPNATQFRPERFLENDGKTIKKDLADLVRF
jgi:cytochrome P450